MTSSLRNSIHRRNHKERSQLAHRSKLGILEKHADYVKRARDYHSKQDRLTRLKQKAAERNKDEFYFSMQKQKTKGGVHIKDRGNVALPTDIVKVLKTQDENYVRTMRAAGLKKIYKLKGQLMAMADLMKPGLRGAPIGVEANDELDEEELAVLIDAGIISQNPKSRRRRPNHILFVEDEGEARKYTGDNVQSDKADVDMDIPVEEDLDLGWKPTNEKRKPKQLKHSPDPAGDGGDITTSENNEQGQLNRSRLLKELSARLTRDTQLRYAEREFEMQRLLMGKGSRKKLQGVEKVEGDESDSEDEDEIDARKGKRRASVKTVDEKAYKPRVYKWKLERKR